MSKMLQNSPTCICNSKKFSGGQTPRIPVKEDGREREEKRGKRRGGGRVASWLLGDRRPCLRWTLVLCRESVWCCWCVYQLACEINDIYDLRNGYNEDDDDDDDDESNETLQKGDNERLCSCSESRSRNDAVLGPSAPSTGRLAGLGRSMKIYLCSSGRCKRRITRRRSVIVCGCRRTAISCPPPPGLVVDVL